MTVKRFRVTDSCGNLVCVAKGEVDRDGNLVRLFDMAFQRKELQSRLEAKSYKWREHVKKFYECRGNGGFYSSILKELCAYWNELVVMVAAHNNKFVSWDLIREYLLTARVMPSEYCSGALDCFEKACSRSDRKLQNDEMEKALLGLL